MFTLKRRSLGDNLLYHLVKVKGGKPETTCNDIAL